MITDELREFVEGHLYLGATALGGWKDAALAIADRIEDAAHEEAKRIAKMAFDGGIEYERTCRQYNCDAKAYDWEGWLERHADLFRPKPTVQSVLQELVESTEGQNEDFTKALIDKYAKRLRLAEEEQ